MDDVNGGECVTRCTDNGYSQYYRLHVESDKERHSIKDMSSAELERYMRQNCDRVEEINFLTTDNQQWRAPYDPSVTASYLLRDEIPFFYDPDKGVVFWAPQFYVEYIMRYVRHYAGLVGIGANLLGELGHELGINNYTIRLNR